MSSLANEAVNKSRVFQAIGLCRKLFRDNRDKAATNEHAAALALRDTAVALSTWVSLEWNLKARNMRVAIMVNVRAGRQFRFLAYGMKTARRFGWPLSLPLVFVLVL